MEIARIENELAYLTVNGREETLLEELFEFGKKPDKIRGNPAWHPKESERFSCIMQELFPTIPLRKGSTNGYDMHSRPHHTLNKTELDIDVHAEVRTYCPQQSTLQIVKDDGYAAAVRTHSYDFGVIDDLVERIGSKLDPVIIPWQQSRKERSTAWKYHPRVIGFDAVQDVYRKASHALGRLAHFTDATMDDLRVLRRDAAEHKNLYVRKGSASMYEGYLNELTAHALER